MGDSNITDIMGDTPPQTLGGNTKSVDPPTQMKMTSEHNRHTNETDATIIDSAADMGGLYPIVISKVEPPPVNETIQDDNTPINNNVPPLKDFSAYEIPIYDTFFIPLVGGAGFDGGSPIGDIDMWAV